MKRLLIALAVAIGAGAAPLAAAAAPAPSPVEDAFRKGFREGAADSEFGRFLLENFPKDYKQLEDEVISAIQRGDANMKTLEARGEAFGAGLIDRYSHFQKSAPDRELVAVGSALVVLLQTLQPIDPVLCYRLGEGEDGAADAEFPTAADDALMGVTMATLKAIVAGRDHPVRRKPVRDGDFEKLLDKFVSMGGELSWLSAMQDGTTAEFSAETRCAQALLFARATVSLKPDIAARILAPE